MSLGLWCGRVTALLTIPTISFYSYDSIKKTVMTIDCLSYELDLFKRLFSLFFKIEIYKVTLLKTDI